MITNHKTCLLTKAMEPSCMYYVCVFNTYVPYAIRIVHIKNVCAKTPCIIDITGGRKNNTVIPPKMPWIITSNNDA